MQAEWEPDELIDAWTLTGNDWDLIANKAGVTRLGFAVMLKFYEIEGRFPAYPQEVPPAAVSYLGSLVKVDPALFAKYSWTGRSIKYRRSQIRKVYGTRPPTAPAGGESSTGSRRPRTLPLAVAIGVPGRFAGHAEGFGDLGDGVLTSVVGAGLVVHVAGHLGLPGGQLGFAAADPAAGPGGFQALAGAFGDEVGEHLVHRGEHVEGEPARRADSATTAMIPTVIPMMKKRPMMITTDSFMATAPRSAARSESRIRRSRLAVSRRVPRYWVPRPRGKSADPPCARPSLPSRPPRVRPRLERPRVSSTLPMLRRHS